MFALFQDTAFLPSGERISNEDSDCVTQMVPQIDIGAITLDNVSFFPLIFKLTRFTKFINIVLRWFREVKRILQG